jgi:16S rRNA (adenine1518-N6/adenine1519-N6)-dimethyltransferase
LYIYAVLSNFERMTIIKPLKQFGQNYLTDRNILRKIAEEIKPGEDDNLIEIGPGTGALTEFLYQYNRNLTAVEIDTRVIEELKHRFPEVNVLQQDFLKTDLTTLYSEKKQKLRIAGNIPYNITSPIIFKIIRNSNIISDAVLLVQHEMAVRMAADRGTKDYSILSVLLKYFTEVKYVFKVSANVFYPKPKVSSAVVHLFIKKDYEPEDEMFIKIVKAAFGKRRKTLKNSLRSSIFAEFDFEMSGIDLSKRAEQLEVNDFIRLAEYTRSIKDKSITE